MFWFWVIMFAWIVFAFNKDENKTIDGISIKVSDSVGPLKIDEEQKLWIVKGWDVGTYPAYRYDQITHYFIEDRSERRVKTNTGSAIGRAAVGSIFGVRGALMGIATAKRTVREVFCVNVVIYVRGEQRPVEFEVRSERELDRVVTLLERIMEESNNG